MSGIRVIGVDPGPTPGLVGLLIDEHRIVRTDVVQCTHGISADVLRSLIGLEGPVIVQLETFVIGRGSMRAGTAGAITRQNLTVLHHVAETSLVVSKIDVRTASQAKGWATDERLERAGLDVYVKGMRHARDAARHALYLATRSGVLFDPLSKEFKR